MYEKSASFPTPFCFFRTGFRVVFNKKSGQNARLVFQPCEDYGFIADNR
jgi:hypothetical protein